MNLDRVSAAAAAPIIVDAVNKELVDLSKTEDLLTWLGPLAKGAVPKLQEILDDWSSRSHKRHAAARILAAIGPASESRPR